MTAFCYGYDCSRWCLWQAVQSVYGSDYDSVVSRADDVRAGYSTVLLYEPH